MPGRVSIRLIGIEAMKDELIKLYNALSETDRSSILQRVADRFAAIIKANFTASTLRPLDPDTLRRRRSAGISGDTPLQASGKMLASISSSATKDTASAGPEVDYAIHQQLGYKLAGGKRKVPARPFVWLGAADVEEAMDTIERGVFGDAA